MSTFSLELAAVIGDATPVAVSASIVEETSFLVEPVWAR